MLDVFESSYGVYLYYAFRTIMIDDEQALQPPWLLRRNTIILALARLCRSAVLIRDIVRLTLAETSNRRSRVWMRPLNGHHCVQ